MRPVSVVTGCSVAASLIPVQVFEPGNGDCDSLG